MLCITTAVGAHHRHLATRLRASFLHWGWPPLQVVTDLEVTDQLPAGRGLKTRFAEFAPPDHTGPVMFIDCDCEATGPFQGVPDHLPGTVSAVVNQRYRDGRIIFQTQAVFAADLATGLKLCRAWHALLVETGSTSDEPAFNRVLERMSYFDMGGSFDWPRPNLRHRGAESLIRCDQALGGGVLVPDGRYTEGPTRLVAAFRAAVRNGLMARDHYARVVREAAGKSLLVFGAGHDSALWRAVVAPEDLVIAETDPAWVARTPGSTHVDIPGYRDTWLPAAPLPEPLRRQFACVLVDGPPGHSPGTPGRQLAIAWASEVATETIFVHDYERSWERECCDALLGPPVEILTGRGSLAVFDRRSVAEVTG